MFVVQRQASFSRVFKEGMTIEARYVKKKDLINYLPASVLKPSVPVSSSIPQKTGAAAAQKEQVAIPETVNLVSATDATKHESESAAALPNPVVTDKKDMPHINSTLDLPAINPEGDFDDASYFVKCHNPLPRITDTNGRGMHKSQSEPSIHENGYDVASVPTIADEAGPSNTEEPSTTLEAPAVPAVRLCLILVLTQ